MLYRIFYRAAAHAELQKHIDALQGKQGQALVDAFCAAAQQRSDCGSFKAGGDLGFFGRGAGAPGPGERGRSHRLGAAS